MTGFPQGHGELAPPDPHRAKRDTLKRRLERINFQANDIQNVQLIRSPRGGRCTLRDAQSIQNELRVRVDAEIRQGDHRHDRVGRWLRQVPKLLIADLLVTVWFFSSVFNVDWAQPAVVPLLLSLVFAFLATGIGYIVLTKTGEHLRTFKDWNRKIPWHALDATAIGFIAGAVVVSALLSAMVYVRLHEEIFDALGSEKTGVALTVAVIFACLYMAGNLAIVAVNAFDGSEITHELEAFGRAIKRPSRKIGRLRRKAHRIGVSIKQLEEATHGPQGRSAVPHTRRMPMSSMFGRNTSASPVQEDTSALSLLFPGLGVPASATWQSGFGGDGARGRSSRWVIAIARIDESNATRLRNMGGLEPTSTPAVTDGLAEHMPDETWLTGTELRRAVADGGVGEDRTNVYLARDHDVIVIDAMK